MGKPKPLTQDQVSGEVQEIFDQLKETYGLSTVPNAFGLMARCPEILKAYLPLRKAVNQPGVLEQKYKELAWLKASNVNGCVA
jgi:alkylhydroperoxidase/carboxymuconolactone decarboxylase family protein YurZ